MISDDPLFSDIIHRLSQAELRAAHLTDLVVYMAMGIPEELMPAHLKDLLNGIVNE